jgi:hypothetical protein
MSVWWCGRCESCWHRKPAHNILAVMPTIRLCPSCEQFLATASDAMCHHAEAMQRPFPWFTLALPTRRLTSFYEATRALTGYGAK